MNWEEERKCERVVDDDVDRMMMMLVDLVMV